MTLFLWILLGVTAGWLASLIANTKATQGLVTDILLGVVGAIVGGLILNVIGQPGFDSLNIYSIAMTILGAVVLIWFGRVLNAPSR